MQHIVDQDFYLAGHLHRKGEPVPQISSATLRRLLARGLIRPQMSAVGANLPASPAAQVSTQDKSKDCGCGGKKRPKKGKS